MVTIIVISNSASKFYCKSRLPQYYSAFAVNLAIMSVGIAWAWTSVAIPDINVNSKFGPLNPIQESWIASIVMLGSIFACPFSGLLMKVLGLRGSMLALTLPLAGGWMVILFSNNFWTLLTGRFITGFCAGFISVGVPVFVAETTEVEIRGRLGSGFGLMGSCGQLIIYIFGSCVSWRWQSLASGIIPLASFFLLMVVPESPMTLISKNKIEEAKESLAWFRGSPSVDLIQDEFNTFLEASKTSNIEKLRFEAKDYFSPPILRPTLICVTLTLFIQTTGIVPVLAYTVEIFKAAGVTNSFMATVVIGITQVVMAFPAAFLVDKIGRRILLMISSALLSITLIILGGYMYWKDALDGWQWLPLACLIVYISAFSIGFGSVPWVIMGEIIPCVAKEFSSAVVVFSSRTFTFLIVFFFHDIIKLMGEHGCFWFFAGACITAFTYVYFYLPETKGKSLAEIQDSFKNSKNT